MWLFSSIGKALKKAYDWVKEITKKIFDKYVNVNISTKTTNTNTNHYTDGLGGIKEKDYTKVVTPKKKTSTAPVTVSANISDKWQDWAISVEIELENYSFSGEYQQVQIMV